jgi:hypothetical protein
MEAESDAGLRGYIATVKAAKRQVHTLLLGEIAEISGVAWVEEL